MLRKSYSLTDKEHREFYRLPPEEGVAISFWGYVAHSRGLDPATVIGDESDPEIFTAMTYGHGKDWCFPMPLACSRKARWNGKDVYFEKE